jgi:hypothetical protein
MYSGKLTRLLMELGTQLPQVSRMIINIRSLPTPTLRDGPGDSINLVSSDVVFAENSAYDEGQSGGGISEVRRMINTPRGLRRSLIP